MSLGGSTPALALGTLALVIGCGTPLPSAGDESSGTSTEGGSLTATGEGSSTLTHGSSTLSSEGSSSTTADDASETGSSSSESGVAPSTSVTTDLESSSSTAITSDTEASTDTSTSSGQLCSSSIPEALIDRYSVGFENDPLVVADPGVLDNDTDADADALDVMAFDASSDAGGTIAGNATGGFTYTPPDDFWGEDGFSYTLSDDNGCTATGRVQVIVYPTALGVSDVVGSSGAIVIEGAIEGSRSGSDVERAGDVNGDGLADIAIGAPRAMVDGVADVGMAYVVFGRGDVDTIDLADIAAGNGGFALVGEAAEDFAGESVAGLGDLNGDQLSDIAVGAYGVDAQGENAGRVYVVFGKQDGDAIQLADVASGVGGFVIDGEMIDGSVGERVRGAGDVNGDGLHDVLVGAGYESPTPAYVVFGKASGYPVLLADVTAGEGGFAITGTGYPDNTIRDVAGAGDVDGDGLADVLVGLATSGTDMGYCAGRIYVVFGKSSTSLVTLSDVVAGVGGFVIDGADGSVLGSIDCSGSFAGAGVDGAGDVDADGHADVVIGADETAYIVFGKADTASVWLGDVDDGIGGIQFDHGARRVAGGGDVDADGVPDVVLGGASVPFLGHRDYVVFGQSMDASVAGADLAEGIGGFALDQPFEAHRAYHVAMLDDVNGDGYADIGVGAPIVGQYAPEAGRTYVILGGNFTGSVTHSGTEDVDALVGTASDDAIVAGRGDDSLVGAGGVDVLYCGPEDDVVEIADAAFARIDGGTGVDTLAWQAAGATLDLSALPDDAVAGIEIIDIAGSGDNGLVLERRDLLWISETSNALTVTGDLGDTLEADLSGGGFVDLGSAGGFTEYGNGVSTLRVSDALASNVAL